MPIFEPKQQNLFHFNQFGVIQLIPLLLIIGGIVAGVYIIQKEGFQIFKSKASSKNIEVLDGECVKVVNGSKVLTCDRFQFKVTSPLETSN